MNSLLTLNTDDAYADNGVLWMTAALFGFRIDVYSGSDLTTPTVSYNRTQDQSRVADQFRVNLYFSGPQTHGHFDYMTTSHVDEGLENRLREGNAFIQSTLISSQKSMPNQ